MCHVWGEKMCIRGFWWENLRERNDLEDLGVDGGVILKCIVKKSVGRVWTGLIGFRIGASGTLL
jgi:hypothetical protein